jgi:hypothetical protein
MGDGAAPVGIGLGVEERLNLVQTNAGQAPLAKLVQPWRK